MLGIISPFWQLTVPILNRMTYVSNLNQGKFTYSKGFIYEDEQVVITTCDSAPFSYAMVAENMLRLFPKLEFILMISSGTELTMAGTNLNENDLVVTLNSISELSYPTLNGYGMAEFYSRAYFWIRYKHYLTPHSWEYVTTAIDLKQLLFDVIARHRQVPEDPDPEIIYPAVYLGNVQDFKNRIVQSPTYAYDVGICAGAYVCNFYSIPYVGLTIIRTTSVKSRISLGEEVANYIYWFLKEKYLLQSYRSKDVIFEEVPSVEEIISIVEANK